MCSFIPAGVGERARGRKLSKSAIDRSINKSVKAGTRKGHKRDLSRAKKSSTWPGARRTIRKKRPRGAVSIK